MNERLLTPDGAELQVCACGTAMELQHTELMADDVALKFFTCTKCTRELRLIVWDSPTPEDRPQAAKTPTVLKDAESQIAPATLAATPETRSRPTSRVWATGPWLPALLVLGVLLTVLWAATLLWAALLLWFEIRPACHN